MKKSLSSIIYLAVIMLLLSACRREIVFFSNRDGDFEIYLMKADGSEQKRLINNPGTRGADKLRVRQGKLM
jgi:hypothetical protein